jgi:DNA-binding transcriptional LysR family regulator
VLDIRKLRVLLAVVESGSMTAAADDLGYTPSAVSQHVAALEREAGTPLLERVGRGVRPTAAGRLLAEHTAPVLARLAEAEAALADLMAGRIGRLGVTFFPTAGASLVPPAVAEFRRLHPAVELELRVAEPAEAIGALLARTTDVAVVVAGSDQPANTHWQHLLDDPYHIVLPRAHPLAERPVLDLAAIADEPWVNTASVPGPCLQAISAACELAGFTPQAAVHADDYPTTQGLVAAGVGVALVPGLALGAVHPGVTVRRIRQHRPVRSIHAVVRHGCAGDPAVCTMLQALRAAALAHRDQPAAEG